MGQDVYQFTTIPRKFKYDSMTAENGSSSPMQLEVFPVKKQKLFALHNTTMGNENTCALSAQGFEDRFQVRYLLWQ